MSGCMFLLVPAHPGSPGPSAVKRLYVCVCMQQDYNIIIMRGRMSKPNISKRHLTNS